MTRRDWTLLFLIFAIALVVRTAWLDQFPPGLWYDEGLNGVDAWRTLHGGPRGEATGFRMVYPDVFPREPLLVWVLGVVLSVTGTKIIAMRLVTVLIGAMACAVTYRAVRFIERNRGLALAAAFVLATMHWHAHFSRLVFRTNWVPLLAIAVVCRMSWAADAERTKGRGAWWQWLLVGMLAGVGFYAYLSWYFFVPVIALWFWALRSDDLEKKKSTEPSRRHFWWAALPFVLGAAVIYSPMAVHYLTSPEDLTGRPQAVSPLSEGPVEGAKLMARNAADVALMFALRGDHVPLHNVAEPTAPGDPDFGKTGSPVFDPVWAVFFFAGIVLAIIEAVRTRGRRRRIAAAWLGWLVMMSLPSVVSQTDSANTLRNLGATPAVAFFVAKGWWRFYVWIRQRMRERGWSGAVRQALGWACVALFIWGAAFQVHKSWWRHPRVDGIRSSFSGFFVELADFSTREPDALLFVPRSIYEHYTYAFLTLQREDIRPVATEPVLAQDQPPRDHRVLLTGAENYQILNETFPEGRLEEDRLLTRHPQTGQMAAAALIYRIPAPALLPPEAAAEKADTIPLEASR